MTHYICLALCPSPRDLTDMLAPFDAKRLVDPYVIETRDEYCARKVASDRRLSDMLVFDDVNRMPFALTCEAIAASRRLNMDKTEFIDEHVRLDGLETNNQGDILTRRNPNGRWDHINGMGPGIWSAEYAQIKGMTTGQIIEAIEYGQLLPDAPDGSTPWHYPHALVHYDEVGKLEWFEWGIHGNGIFHELMPFDRWRRILSSTIAADIHKPICMFIDMHI